MVGQGPVIEQGNPQYIENIEGHNSNFTCRKDSKPFGLFLPPDYGIL